MRIAIVGGGYSGIAALVNLTYFIKTKQIADISVNLFESELCLGGLAYGQYPLPEHLMNVPIKVINSFLPDHLISPNIHSTLKIDPLLVWLNRRIFPKILYTENDFCSRMLYGEYLRYVAKQCEQILQKKVIHLNQKVKNVLITYLRRESLPHYTLIFEEKRQDTFHGLIWATGYSEHIFEGPKNLSDILCNYYTRNLWDKEHGLKHFLDTDIEEKTILVIGSALSAMDVIVSLFEKIKNEQYHGQIYMVSRHGLLHSPIIEGNEGISPDEKIVKKISQTTVEEKIYALEKIFSDCKKYPDLISFTQDGYILANYLLETLLSDRLLDERNRSYVVELYLKNQFTDVFATGMPEPTQKKIGELMKKNRLIIRQGSVQSVLPKKQHLEVNLQSKTFDKEYKYEPGEIINVSHIINATGDTEIKSQLDTIFIGQTDLFKITAFDLSGHFIKSVASNTFLGNLLYIGPQRAISSISYHGNTRSTARSIIELRLQAHEVAEHLLYGLQLLEKAAFKRPSSTDFTSTSTLDYKYLPSYQLHQPSITKVKRTAVMTTSQTDTQQLHSDTVVIPDHSSDQPESIEIYKEIIASFFFAGKRKITNEEFTLYSHYIDMDETRLGRRTTVSTDQGRLKGIHLSESNQSLSILVCSGVIHLDEVKVGSSQIINIESVNNAIKNAFFLARKINSLYFSEIQQKIHLDGLLVKPIFKVSQISTADIEHKIIVIHCGKNKQFIAYRFSAEFLHDISAPVFIHLPLEQLIDENYTEYFTVDSIIRHFYEKSTAIFLQKDRDIAKIIETYSKCVFVITGYSIIKNHDSFNYVKDCITEIYRNYRVIVLLNSDESIAEDKLLPPDQILNLEFNRCYYFPVSILKMISTPDSTIIDLEHVFTQLIKLKLILPYPAPNKPIEALLDSTTKQKEMLPTLVKSLNEKFNPDLSSVVSNSQSVLLVHIINHIIKLCQSYHLQGTEILTLVLKKIGYDIQKDTLQIDKNFFTYMEHLFKSTEQKPDHHPLIAKYYGILVNFNIGARAEPIEFLRLTEKMNDFIRYHGLQRADLLTKHQWLQNLYYNLGVAYLEAGRLSQALRTLLKIATLSLIKLNARIELSYHTNLGVVYEEMGNMEQAKTHYQLAVTIHEQKSADPNVGHQYNALANLYLTGSDLLNAAACYRDSIKWSKYYRTRNKAPRYIGWAQYGLAKIACYLNDQPAAIHYMNEFIQNINLIFPNWPSSYRRCLKSLESSIIFIRISKPISSTQTTTADIGHYRLFSLSRTSDSEKKNSTHILIKSKL